MYRTSLLAVTLLSLGCEGKPSPAIASAAPSAERTGSPAASTIAPTAAPNAASTASPAATPAAAHIQGRIPVLEYHVIGGVKDAMYTRTAEHYRADLETAYKLGYRPINIAQMLDRNFSDVPSGMSPVVVVFDDASPSQFRYLEKGGKLEIDPTSAVGIWMDFARTHPGWKSRAVFCLLNGAGAGHNFFGDGPKWDGQKRDWRFQKVKWLADQGFELCDHTLWHAMLNKYPDAVVQEQIARNLMGIDSAVPGYKVRTMALPYGIWPKNRALAWQGSWTDPKTGKPHAYRFDAVLEVSGGPARSPYDPQFNAHSISRVQAVGDDISRTLHSLAQSGSRFVVK